MEASKYGCAGGLKLTLNLTGYSEDASNREPDLIQPLAEIENETYTVMTQERHRKAVMHAPQSKRRPKTPLVTKCIFEEPSHKHSPLTREHVWGEWLKAYVPLEMNKHHLQRQVIGKPGTPDRSELQLRSGDPLTSNLKIVCKQCNNGWLSQIQVRAKPHLISLIQGKATALGPEAQQAVATWCAMATMTGELLAMDPTSLAISQGQRDWLRDNRSPPDKWRIWIGHYIRHKWPGRWVHVAMPILDAATIVRIAEDRLAPPNTQTTTFVVGKLLVHVMSTSAERELVDHWNWPPTTNIHQRLAQIHPLKETAVIWPPTSLTDNEANIVSTAFDYVIDAASRSAMGNRLF